MSNAKQFDRDVNFLVNHIMLLCYNLSVQEALQELDITLFSAEVKAAAKLRIESAMKPYAKYQGEQND